MRSVQSSFLRTSLLRTMGAIVALAGAHSAAAAPQATAYEGWQDKTVPLEAFGLFPTIEGPRISPDGKWIAAKVRNGGAQVLAVMPVDVKAGKTISVTRDGDFDTEKLGERRASSWVWIDSDHLLITVTSRSRIEGDWVDYSGLASWSRITGKLTRLGWRVTICTGMPSGSSTAKPASG